MIELINIRKTFYNNDIINNLSLHVGNATIFGLIGAAGSGKSTILRLIAGIYHADGGYVKIDGQSVYENPLIKQQISLVSDDPYFLAQATLADMRKFYQIHYPDFSDKIYRNTLQIFQINEKKKLYRLPEGLRKQAALILALACNCKYLLLDGAFSGLEYDIRRALVQLLKTNLEQSGQTTVITSNNLNDLQDVCDSLAFLQNGKIILQGSQAELSQTLSKFQLSFTQEKTRKDFSGLELLAFNKRGHVITLIVRGEPRKTKKYLESLQPLFIDNLTVDLADSFMFAPEMQDHG